MEYKKSQNVYLIRLEKGEEVLEALHAFCKKEQILAGVISGIGAASEVTVGLYDSEKKEFFSNTYQDALEITSLTGNISSKMGEPYLHLHITVADGSNRVLGGHLSRCIISVTGEISVISLDLPTSREPDMESGIQLLHFPDGTVLS